MKGFKARSKVLDPRFLYDRDIIAVISKINCRNEGSSISSSRVCLLDTPFFNGGFFFNFNLCGPLIEEAKTAHLFPFEAYLREIFLYIDQSQRYGMGTRIDLQYLYLSVICFEHFLSSNKKSEFQAESMNE